MSSEFEDWLDLAVSLCKLGGAKAKEYTHMSSIRPIEAKFECKVSNTDLVTDVDRSVEKLIRDAVVQMYPKHHFVGEETMVGKVDLYPVDGQPTWVVDPIDGTMNFVHGYPNFCISIGVLLDGKSVVGAVYDVLADRLYTGIRGKGSFCNGQRLQVTDCKTIEKCLLSTDLAGSRDDEFCRETAETFTNFLSSGVAGIRMIGSCVASILRVAEGASDILIVKGCHIWDVAAVCIILEEAGGKLFNYNVPDEVDLRKRKFIASCTLELAQSIAPLVAWTGPLEED